MAETGYLFDVVATEGIWFCFVNSRSTDTYRRVAEGGGLVAGRWSLSRDLSSSTFVFTHEKPPRYDVRAHDLLISLLTL